MNFQWHKVQKQKQRVNKTDITNFNDGEKQTLYNHLQAISDKYSTGTVHDRTSQTYAKTPANEY